MSKFCSISVTLDRNQLVLSASESDSGAAITVTRSGDSVTLINSLSEAFRQLVVFRSFAVENDSAVLAKVHDLGAELYNLFVAGFEEIIHESSAILFRHQRYFLPPELAFDGKQFLGMRYAIGNWTERWGTLETLQNATVEERMPRCLVIGPEEDFVSEAFRRGATPWRCDILAKTGADHLLFQLKNENYDILHFACHGEYNEDDPDLGFWVLDDSRGPTDQGTLLRCGQLKAVSLRRYPLVFLNACQSGLVSKDYRGFTGFAETLLDAGVGNCIATLWSITDQGAVVFAANFYKGLTEGKSVGEALRQARQICWITGESPLTSLAYTLFGDPDTTLPAANRRSEQEELPSPPGQESTGKDPPDGDMRALESK